MHVRRRTRLAVALAAGCASAVLLAACGGSDEDASAPANGNDALAAYRACLEEEGIDTSSMGAGQPGGSGFPRPSGSGSAMPRPPGSALPSGFPGGGPGFGGMRPEGVDEQTWQNAQDACQSTMPTGFPGGGDQPGAPAGSANPNGGSDAAYTTCLADHEGQSQADAEEACKVLSPSPS